MKQKKKDFPLEYKDASEILYTREEYLTPNTRARADLKLVMSQTEYDEESTIKALLHNGGDIVNAIMDLTS